MIMIWLTLRKKSQIRETQARIKEKGARKGIYPYISLTAPLSFFPRRGAGGEVYTIG
jgi:hypothetical protein